MWKLVYGSVRGTSHTQSGQACQDYATGRIIDTSSGPVLIAACADGAGSADHSDVGAKLAVETFVANVADALQVAGIDASAIDEDILREWNLASRRRIELEAEYLGTDVRQMACTLLTAVVAAGSAAFSQIGDGAIALDGSNGHEIVFWPDSGEYVNTTSFLSDQYLDRHLRSVVVSRRVTELAILTDGLQMLALDFAHRQVYRPFFKPVFEVLRAAEDGDSVRDSLHAFLDSERVNQRTDDDKTLLLATRIPTPCHAANGTPPTD